MCHTLLKKTQIHVVIDATDHVITRCLSSKCLGQLCNTMALYWQGKDNRLLPSNYGRVSTTGILLQTTCCICLRCERCSRGLGSRCSIWTSYELHFSPYWYDWSML